MSDQTAPTLGSKIDALLTPFVQDEAELQQRLAALQEESERIESEMQQVQEDLGVVQSAKINALREAAASDPLMSAAFAQTPVPKMTSTGEAEVIDETNSADSHPLLSHAS